MELLLGLALVAIAPIAIWLVLGMIWLGVTELWGEAELRSRRALRIGSAMHRTNWPAIGTACLFAVAVYIAIR